MSTRATIHFQYEYDDAARGREWVTDAIIYRHGDGYPEGLGKDLEDFLDEVINLRNTMSGTRFGDPAYLAAKWVVFDATRRVQQMQRQAGATHYLAFLSVGIVKEDPGDIEYRYLVRCVSDGARPEIVVEEVH